MSYGMRSFSQSRQYPPTLVLERVDYMRTLERDAS